MQRNPTLPTKSLEVQLRTLVIEPFKRLEPLVIFVIVDGLGKCQGDRIQGQFYNLSGTL